MLVVLMVGIPGSGKTFWAHDMSASLRRINSTSAIISRDEIRKSFIGKDSNDSNYFSKELDVFDAFVNQVNEAMSKYDCVFIDATHITPASRRKIISRLTPPADAQLFIKTMYTPFKQCMERNSKRSGFALVPVDAMRRMERQLITPTEEEFKASWNPFKETIVG